MKANMNDDSRPQVVFQRGISISDNAISSYQIPPSIIAYKISGIFSLMFEKQNNREVKSKPIRIAGEAKLVNDGRVEGQSFRRTYSAHLPSLLKKHRFSTERRLIKGNNLFREWSLPSRIVPSAIYANECGNEARADNWLSYGFYSSLGALCENCASQSFTEAAVCKGFDLIPSLQSYNSIRSLTSECSEESCRVTREKLCRICHCSAAPNDNLISPCRCSGSLQYVHMSCLLHWLAVCSRKLRRPPICELCLYKYKRRRIFKWTSLRLPSIPEHNFGYMVVFSAAVSLMVLSAITSFSCFYLERKLGIIGYSKAVTVETKEWENILSSTTLASAIVFFIGLFIAMYIHIKTDVSPLNYFTLCWRNNQDWIIEEYRPSSDIRYSHKLEQLRQRLRSEGLRSPGSVDPQEANPLYDAMTYCV